MGRLPQWLKITYIILFEELVLKAGTPAARGLVDALCRSATPQIQPGSQLPSRKKTLLVPLHENLCLPQISVPCIFSWSPGYAIQRAKHPPRESCRTSVYHRKLKSWRKGHHGNTASDQYGPIPGYLAPTNLLSGDIFQPSKRFPHAIIGRHEGEREGR